ncbi:putative bifunctional diguanylate cyclase/phosphodiesterase [Roseibium suaedae]|uniref:Diguanylate cyclase/phosphodiesterase n=1 Tax=Roseibium suaedae TaxID=735517 RepID=A0A1M7N1L2_9HYPH|nr:EAL domain-containing protein [Roseibium suaedae]SHM97232.1 diguanylate cyclase/phosphodiesterase [Roseibium suaedae]
MNLIAAVRVLREKALQKVFVRSTIYMALMLCLFAFLVSVVTFHFQAGKIREDVEERAFHVAGFVASVVGPDLVRQNVDRLGQLMNQLASKNPIKFARVYSVEGKVIASDEDSSRRVSRRMIDVDVLRSILQGTQITRENDARVEQIQPVFFDGEVIGAVSVVISKDRLQELRFDVILQFGLLILAMCILFLPMVAYLMYRSTHGISRLTQMSNEAAQGFLDPNIPTDTPGEVGELQTAVRTMVTNWSKTIQSVEYLANMDSVTGLPNRLKFENTATQLVEFNPKATGGLLLVDLDRFKAINDTFGHAVGDKLLKLVGERIVTTVTEFCPGKTRSKPLIARFSGDEFTILLPGLNDREVLSELAELILARMSRPFKIDSHSLRTRASIGVAVYPDDGKTESELLQCADLALHRAKLNGRDQMVMFNQSIRDEAQERDRIENSLRMAEENGELEVYYQPKIDMVSGRWVGAEALLRWTHPELGRVSPVKFIPIAEECGLIGPIGEFVLRRSLAQMKELIDEGHDLTVAVNVAPVQLRSPYFTDRTLGILGESGYPLHRLELEITESGVMESPVNIEQQISPIRDEGVRFAIDDFGTGYSSLSNLATMPFDTLKIDRSFVMSMAESEDRRIIVQLILMMAKQLRMQTVAEGIETETQLAALKEWGASYGQGFLWSTPVPFAEFAAKVREQASENALAAKSEPSAA